MITTFYNEEISWQKINLVRYIYWLLIGNVEEKTLLYVDFAFEAKQESMWFFCQFSAEQKIPLLSLQVCFKIQIIVFYDIKQMMTFKIFFFFMNVCDYNNLILQYRFCLCMWYVLFRLKSRGQNHGSHQHWHIDWGRVGAD